MKKIIVGIVILIFTNISIAKAISYVAGDLTYTCLGGNTYLISAAIYRDCSGAPAPNQLTVNFSCGTDSSYNFSATLYRIPGTGYEVTPGCGSLPTTCSGGTAFGVQEYIYQYTVTMIPCANWTMSFQGCCRSQVTTVANNQNNQFFISAFLNNLDAPCNSSPTFSNKPITYSCTTQSHCFNHGASDPNGDSLVFSFHTPNTTNSVSSIIYYPPYSASNFVNSYPPISIDPLTGDICFTAATTIFTKTGVKIEEYRTINGITTLIGIVFRDILIRTKPCPNFIPVLSGMDFSQSHVYNPNDTIHFYSTIAGYSINFDINAYDADTFNPSVSCQNPKVYISWNAGIPQANWNVFYNGTDSAYANFQWTPTSADVSVFPKCFIATVHDNACPYSGSQSYTYCIYVEQNTAIDEHDKQMKFNVYPNPNSGQFNLSFSQKLSETLIIEIFSPTGQSVYKKEIPRSDQKTISVDLKGLAKGVYYIRITNGLKDIFQPKTIVIQ